MLNPKRLVLLPGLDGTGELFDDFLKALPNTFTSTIVAYPGNRSLSYKELSNHVSSAVPGIEPFVVLAESFSTPIALQYAASNPVNLAAVIICAGFVSKPVGGWSRLVKAIMKPWFFRLRPPQFVLEHFLIGPNSPSALSLELRRVLKIVRPEVLSGRVLEAIDCDARDDLSHVTVPMMYMRAGHDRLLSRKCYCEILQKKPTIIAVTVDAPHLLLQREPHKAADLVAAFMTQL